MRNTALADLNEMLLCVRLVDGAWKKIGNADEVKEGLGNRKSEVDLKDYHEQDARARAMATLVRGYISEQKGETEVEEVWWTARPGSLKRATGMDVCSKGNPSDVICRVGGEWLGVSAKTSKTSSDIAFKNPGIATIDKAIGTNLQGLIDRRTQSALEQLSLPSTVKARKEYIRSSESVRARTQSIGMECLACVRDELYETLVRMTGDGLRDHIETSWMDSINDEIPYVKVTSYGSQTPYRVSIEHPSENEKVSTIRSGNIIPVKLGETGVGIIAEGLNIMKIRCKYTSEKLASSIKFCGEPWQAAK